MYYIQQYVHTCISVFLQHSCLQCSHDYDLVTFKPTKLKSKSSVYGNGIKIQIQIYFAFYRSIVRKPVGCRISHVTYNKCGINYQFEVLF
jgi:hypothetical protein